MKLLADYFLRLPILVQLDSLSVLFPIVAAAISLRFLTRELKLLLTYQVISLVITIWMTYLASKRVNNLWLFHIQTPIEFFFFMWIFSRWQTNQLLQKFFEMTIPVFIFLWAVLAFFVEKIDEFNTYSKPTEAIVLIIASGYCLYQVNKEKVESLFRQPSFWISSGVLIFFTGTVIVFTVTNIFLRESTESLRLVLSVVLIMNTVANLFYARGFLCRLSIQV